MSDAPECPRDPKRQQFDVDEMLWPAERAGKSQAQKDLERAQRVANAKAAALLAAKECPPDLIEWGRRHKIPEFAKFTWQAGFLAGMRAAVMKDAPDED